MSSSNNVLAQPSTDLSNAALSYAALGYPVIPLQPGGKRPDGRLVPNGLKDASCALATVNDWWSLSPAANVGVRVPGHMVVFDVDKDSDYVVLDQLSREHGLDLDTMVTVSGSGNWHLWYLLPADSPHLVRGDLQGLTVRLPERAYLVMPGSMVRQPDGTLGVYSELNPGAEPKVLPAGLAGHLAAPCKAQGPRAEPRVIPRAFPDRLAVMIESGDHGYPSRSHALVATIVPWRDAGGDRASWLVAVTDPVHGISARHVEKVETNGEGSAISELERMWDYYSTQDSWEGKPSELVIRQAQDAVRPDLLAILDRPANRRTRPQTMAVWISFAELMIRHQTLSPFVVSRDLALMAGIADHKKVHPRLRKFTGPGGFLSESTLVTSGKEGVIVYKVSPYYESVASVSEYGEGLSIPTLPITSSPSLPVWREAALGHGPWLTHGALSWFGEPVTADVVSALTGLHHRTVDNHLARMTDSDLSIRLDSGLWVAGPAHPAEVEWRSGSASIEKQVIRTELDRAARYGSTVGLPDLARAAG